MNWQVKSFESLTPAELYALLRLRSEVFVVEQQCVFLDADNKDQACFHVMGFSAEAELIAYARLVPPGLAFEEPSIGRVITSSAARGTGAGKELLRLSIQYCKQFFGTLPVQIGAQLYLKKFYESFGFVSSGELYLEDGIEHIHMILIHP